MDVLQAAWQALGQPTSPHLDVAAATHGDCARCARPGPVVAAETVLSAKWTGWGSWRTAGRPALCQACAWGYGDTRNRQGAMLITRSPTCARLDPHVLARTLTAAVPVDHAVVLPLRPNRKHVLPEARWGRLTVDDVPVRWTAGDAHRFTVTLRLRRWGFTGRGLAQPAPDFPTLRRLPAPVRRQVLDLWPSLDPWRPNTPWLSAGSLAAGLSLAAA